MTSFTIFTNQGEKYQESDSQRSMVAISRFFSLVVAIFAYRISYSSHMQLSYPLLSLLSLLLVSQGLFVLARTLKMVIPVLFGIVMAIVLYFTDDNDANMGIIGMWFLLLSSIAMLVIFAYTLYAMREKMATVTMASTFLALLGCVGLVFSSGTVLF